MNKGDESNIIIFLDKNLEKVVRDELKIPNGNIFKSDVEKIIYLDACKKGIADISGLENFTNVKELLLGWNELSSLDPLKELTNITFLCLTGNKINENELESLLDSWKKNPHEFEVQI